MGGGKRYMHHDFDDCCTGKVKCKKPIRPRDIKTECIFVEKVFDSRIFKTQEVVDCCPCPIEIDREICEIIEDTVEVTCRVIKFDSKVKVTVTGEGIKYDEHGCPVKVAFTGCDIIECCFENIRVRFNDMCIPNNNAVFPVLIGDACAANCIFDLDFAELLEDCDCGSDKIKLFGELIFCIKCEKKIKFPVELCVLSTGFCREPEVDFTRCAQDDFPDLFPVSYPEDGHPHIFAEEEVVEIIEEPYEESFEEDDIYED